jgi:sugar lactone lactonase YvrE
MQKIAYSAALALLCAHTGFGQNLLIQSVAGGGIPANLPAATASLGYVSGVAVFGGNVYMVLQSYSMVVEKAPSGNLTLIAGNGTAGFSGDGGPASNAQLNAPTGIAFDASGNLYIADSGNNRIRKVSNGTITTLVGGGSITLNSPAAVAVDSSGNVYIADTGNGIVRKWSNGVTTTVASTGLSSPSGIAVDGSGNLYITDPVSDAICIVSGASIGCSPQPANTQPQGVALDAKGDIFVAFAGADAVVEFPVSGNAAIVVGNQTAGYTGDGGPATSAALNSPAALAIDASGNLWIADSGNFVVREVSGGIINTVAGSVQGYVADGPAATAQLFSPSYTAAGPAGELYIVDSGHNSIRKLLNGVVSTVAGTGVPGYSGDNGLATSAQLDDPWGVAVAPNGDLYISDYGNYVIRKVSGGIITTVAGDFTATSCYNGDNIAATAAYLCLPAGIALDKAGNLYIADSANHRVRQISTNGTITTVAGNGTGGYSGDGVAASSSELYNPTDVKVDSAGNLYIADQGNNLIRIVSGGTINTFAGNAVTRTAGFSGDLGPATSALLNAPSGIALDSAGNLYIADTNNNVIREVTNGTINTIAGNGAAAYGGDLGPATSASLNFPLGVSVSSAGQVYIADTGNNLVRALNQPCSYSAAPTSVQATAAGGGFSIAVTTQSYCSWTVSGLPAWASAPSGAVTGPGSVSVVIAPDPGAARSATITVAGVPVTLNQAACTYAVSPGAESFTAAGGTGAVTVTTALVCAWTVTNTNSWITFSAPGGTGSGTVNFTAAAGPTGGQTGTFTVAGATFTVIEQASSLPGLSLIGSMPHIAAEENWTTAFTLVNKGNASATARLSLFSDPSGPLTLPLLLPQPSAPISSLVAASLDEPIAANASLIIDTAGPQTPPVQIGSAQLAATGPVDGFAIFHLIPGSQEAVVPMETRNASSYLLAFDNTSGVVLGVAVANVSAQSANIHFVIRDDTGTLIGSGALSLPGNGHTSFVLSSQSPVTANKRGTIEFDTPAGGQISVLGIRTTPLTTSTGTTTTLTTVPALANVGTGGGSIAHIASGNGWQTTFVLVNAGTTSAQATLKFFADATGAPLTLPISFPQSGGAVSTVSSTTQTLAAGATLLVQSVAPASNPAPTIGSAQLTTTGNVSGFVIFRYNPNGQEAVVPLTSANANAYIIAFDNTAGTATGIAINSVGTQAVNVPVIVRDDAGNQLATDSLSLSANGHLAFTLVSDKYPMTANIRGTVEFDTPAGGQIGALGIRIPVAHTFTTLPALTK